MNNTDPLIISFYTDDWEYPTRAKNLIENCEKLELEYYIEEMPSFKDYLQNTTIKPKFIRDALNKFNKPVLWLDVDGVLLKKPKVRSVTTDIAACKYSNPTLDRDWAVGILLFNPTDAARELLDLWCTLSEDGGTDEAAFDVAWKQLKDKVTVTKLPEKYHFVYWSNKLEIPKNTVFCNQLSKWEDKMRRKKNGVLQEND